MIGNWLKSMAPAHFSKLHQFGHDKKMHLLEGRRGRGKSYNLARWALNCAKQGVPVAANFEFNRHWFAVELRRAGTFDHMQDAVDWCNENIRYVTSWDEVLLSYDCLLILDECNRLFDSMDRAKADRVPKVVFEWLQQSRKSQLTIVFASQSMDWLSSRVAQLFDILWRSKKEVDRDGQPIRFWLYGGDPWSAGLSSEKKRIADYKASTQFEFRYTRLYDTHERIAALPNISRFERFSDVYQEQIKIGICKPRAERRENLTWQQYQELWSTICRNDADDEAPRAEEDKEARPIAM